MVHSQSGYSLSPKRCLFTRYPMVLQETPLRRDKEHKNQSFTACLTCTPSPPFFLSFHTPLPSPFHHPPHPSPTLSTLSLLLRLSVLSWAVGLLFMASPIEDALLYRTLEPSSRPTPFEDVAHNSYLGL